MDHFFPFLLPYFQKEPAPQWSYVKEATIVSMVNPFESSPHNEVTTEEDREPFLGQKSQAWEKGSEDLERDIDSTGQGRTGLLGLQLRGRRREALSANAAWLCHAVLLSASLLFFALSFCVRPAHITDQDYTASFSAWCKYLSLCSPNRSLPLLKEQSIEAALGFNVGVDRTLTLSA